MERLRQGLDHSHLVSHTTHLREESLDDSSHRFLPFVRSNPSASSTPTGSSISTDDRRETERVHEDLVRVEAMLPNWNEFTDVTKFKDMNNSDSLLQDEAIVTLTI